jgi:hypothetical protein
LWAGGGEASAIDCSGAALSQGVIWPPNHTMVPENIVGVTTDPSLMPVAITINSIYQDEPVNALGSGNTAPDGTGVNTSTAYVHAERAGPGTGRIYFITFTTMDQAGNTCGPIPLQANVPHDQGQVCAADAAAVPLSASIERGLAVRRAAG